MALGSSALHFSNELCGCKEILNMQLSLLAPYLQKLLSTLYSFLLILSQGEDPVKEKYLPVILKKEIWPYFEAVTSEISQH